ncbi:Transglutaminase-like enzyme [Flavobacteriaceae bacterium 3519-10]|nr:Transglutaminase-like enzyme [Flavobacteriaceae bacterium 3519-10]
MIKIYTLCFAFLSIILSAQDYGVASIPENLLENSKAIIRESSKDHILKAVNEMEIKSTRAVTVLNASGEEFGVVGIAYSPTHKVSNIKVELYDDTGKMVRTFSRKDFSDYTHNPSAGLYVDDRILVLRPVYTKYPYTVKASYEVNTSDTAFLNFTPVSSYHLAVQKSSFTMLNKSGIKIRTKISDKPLAKVNHSEDGGLWQYSYENIPAVLREDLAPSIDYLVPEVEFSPEKFSLAGRQGDMTTWDSFGKWYYHQLMSPVSELTPQIKAEVAALNLTGSTEEKVKKIYHYMQDKTRYVFIAMGIGGWQPMPASEVSAKGYGDCKALTNYMRTLLLAAGIPSYYAIIYADDSVISFDKDFPKFSGNHAILMVPTEKETIWLENTSQKVAYNHLFYSSHNRNALAVKENGIEIVNTPIYQPEQSKEKMFATIALQADGSIASEAKFEFSGGQYDSNLPLIGLKDDEVQETMKSRHYNLKIDKIGVQNLRNDRENGKIGYDLKLSANGFAKKLGDDLFFPVMPYYQSMTLSGNDERKHPFENSFPFQDDYEIEYSLPAGYRFTDIPAPSTVTTEFGTYSINFKVNENKLRVHRILTIHKGLYPKEKYKEYLAFRKKTASNDNTKILITKL